MTYLHSLESSLIWNVVATLFYLFLFTYLPGRVISSTFKSLKTWDIHLIVGMASLVLGLFFLRWWLPTTVILGVCLVSSLVIVYLLKICLIPKEGLAMPWWAITAVILGTMAQSIGFIQSWFKGLPLLVWDAYANHDQSWHIALITELVHNFPPQVPGYSGSILKNYHYFYDLLLAGQIQVFGGEASYLVQGIYPLIFSLLFGLSIYRLASQLIPHSFLQFVTIILAYFGNNLSYILLLFGVVGVNSWQSDSFLLDQPIIFLFNQQTVWSIAGFNYLLLFIPDLIKERKVRTALPVLILWASLLYIKVYAWLIASVVIGLLWLYHFFTSGKQSKGIHELAQPLTVLAFGGGIISVIIYLLGFQSRGSFIDWNPGWIVTAFYEKVITVHFAKLTGLMMIYQSEGSAFKEALLWILLGLFFLIGNLGIRLLAGGYLFISKRNEWSNLVFIAALVSLGFVFTGNQSHSAFNIIQFAPYAMVLFTVLAVTVVAARYSPVWWKIGVVLLVMAISIPVSMKTLWKNRESGVPFLDLELVDVLTQIQDYSYGSTVSLLYDHDANNRIGAIAQKQGFLADTQQLRVLQTDYLERFTSINWLRSRLCKNNLKWQDTEFKAVRYVITRFDWRTISCLRRMSEGSTVLYHNVDYAVIKMY